jgi:ABC transporter substrate binding protein
MVTREGSPRAGGLMSSDVSVTEHSAQTAPYVDEILKGAKPADLPVEVPTKLELVINLETTMALRLTPPLAALPGHKGNPMSLLKHITWLGKIGSAGHHLFLEGDAKLKAMQSF